MLRLIKQISRKQTFAATQGSKILCNLLAFAVEWKELYIVFFFFLFSLCVTDVFSIGK